MDVSEYIKKVQNKEIDVVEYIYGVIEKIKKIDSEYHYFNAISDELAEEQARKVAKDPVGRLAGLPVSVKDCICVKGVESRGGSAVLNGYRPVFNATVIRKVINEGAIIIGKTAQDEFGFGSFSTNVGVGMRIPLNPFNKEVACGGSSGGSAGIVQKADFAHISLSESTGGSITNPASFCGVYGLCPTYGRVSRYGLMDYGNSLDKIGPMAKKIKDIALMQELISGYDNKDSTSLDSEVPEYAESLNKDVSGMTVGVIDFGIGKDVDPTVNKKTAETIARLESLGMKSKVISLPFSQKYGISTYFLLAMCEASTNLAKYCGMRYGASAPLKGNYNEYFSAVRSPNFGSEAKRRIIIGTFARMAGQRDAYYIKAAQIRTKMIEEYKNAFKDIDVMLSPAVNILPPRFDEIKRLTPLQHYLLDNLTVVPNLVGVPHLSVPTGLVDGLPSGSMFTADHLEEGKLIQIASALERK